MKKLKKYLFILLVFSVFIPKTYAISVTGDHIYADIYTSTEPFTKTTQFYDVDKFTAPTDTFPVFKALIYDTEDITLSCSTPSYDICYRVDHQLFGAHNESISNWVPFAKSLIAESSTLNTMGSIIAIESWDKMNISTFFKRKIESDCVSTTLSSFVIDIYDVPQNKHFYNPNHFGSYYNTYNKSVNEISCTYAQNLIDDYYKTGNFDNEKLEEIQNSVDMVNGKLEDINNYLKDDTAPSADISVLGNVQGILPEGPIDSLLNIPFKVLSILNSSFGGICVPISGKFVFDSNLTIPCFGDMFYNNVPDSIMIFINVVPTAFILIVYLKNLYKRVDRALSLETSADDEWGGI